MLLCPTRLDVAVLDASPFPLDIALVKQHLAVDDTDSDALLQSYMSAAIRWAEGAMHRTIYARSHTWVLADFPRDDRQTIRLPRGKTQSVESIAYSNNGTITTLTTSGTDWQHDLRGDNGGVIMPPRGATWPTVDYDVPAPVAITFTAGWQSAEVPESIIHALLFAVSDAFELRGTGDMVSGGKNFETRNILISPFRLKRWY